MSENQVHSRVSDAELELLDEWTDNRDISRAEGIRQLIHIVCGDGDDTGIHAQLEDIQTQLDELTELHHQPDLSGAPEAPAPAQASGEPEVTADGGITATTTDYSSLGMSHTRPIAPDEADFSDPSVVGQTPAARLPVLRGVLIHQMRNRSTEIIEEQELQNLIEQTFGTTRKTTRRYVREAVKHGLINPHPTIDHRLCDERTLERHQRILFGKNYPRKEKMGLPESFKNWLGEPWQQEYNPVFYLNQDMYEQELKRITAYCRREALKAFSAGAHSGEARYKWQLFYHELTEIVSEQLEGEPGHSAQELHWLLLGDERVDKPVTREKLPMQIPDKPEETEETVETEVPGGSE